MASLIQGRIVWLKVVDPQGRNPKIRPVIIIDYEPNKIPDDQPLHGICVTHEIGISPREDCVPVPWNVSGNVLTKLTKESEAVCTWQVSFTRSEIEKTGGLLRATDTDKLLDKLREIQARGD